MELDNSYKEALPKTNTKKKKYKKSKNKKYIIKPSWVYISKLDGAAVKNLYLYSRSCAQSGVRGWPWVWIHREKSSDLPRSVLHISTWGWGKRTQISLALKKTEERMILALEHLIRLYVHHILLASFWGTVWNAHLPALMHDPASGSALSLDVQPLLLKPR